MHTISSTIPIPVVGAGRHPLTPFQSYYTVHIDVADNLKGLFGLQTVDGIETLVTTPTPSVPVPALTLHRVRTINRIEGLAVLEKRKAYKEDFINTFPLAKVSSLKRVRAVNKLEGLAMLARRKALYSKRTPGDPFLSEDTADALSATANLENRERRKAPIVERQSVPTCFVPEYLNHLSTPPPLARRTNVEDSDVSEDARIAYAMWVKDREARFAGEYSVATQPMASLARVMAIGKQEGRFMLGRRHARFAKDSVVDRSLVSSLVRVRTINKSAGLKERERRKTRVIERPGYTMAMQSKVSPTHPGGNARKRGARRMNPFDFSSLFKKFADVLERAF